MGTCWLFCLAASALSSGRAAEEEERKRVRRRKGAALGLNTEQICKGKEVRDGTGRGLKRRERGSERQRKASLRMMNWLSSC